MKKMILFFIMSSLFLKVYTQCDCEKIIRPDGVITTCKTLPVAGNEKMQLGLSLAFNGKDYFLTSTIRFLVESPLKIKGDLSIRLNDNNLLTFELVKTQGSYIGNSIVEHGIFSVNEDLLDKLQKSKILTITLNLDDNRMYTFEASMNQDVLQIQINCLK